MNEFNLIGPEPNKKDSNGAPRQEPLMPTNSSRADLRSGVKSIIHRAMPADPSWLDGRSDPDLNMLLPVANGLLNLRTRELKPLTPRYFTLSGVSYAYDPNAACPTWDQFMKDILDEDQESINFIEELYGYCLTTDTRFHKIFAMYGPPRSGRGTILRVLDALTESTASIPFRKLDKDFTYESAIGKKVLAIPDLRLGNTTDVQAALEMLISISGGDKQDISRKHKVGWSGILYSRIVFAANELQKLNDTSRALEMRLIVLNLIKSFAGKEDVNLTDKLVKELPGILNKALDGLKRLYARKMFLQPATGRAKLDAQVSKSDPDVGFITDLCILEQSDFVLTETLWQAYEAYAVSMRVSEPRSLVTFGRDLIPKFPITKAKLKKAEAESMQNKYMLMAEGATDKNKKAGYEALAKKYHPDAYIYRGVRLVDDWAARIKTVGGDTPF